MLRSRKTIFTTAFVAKSAFTTKEFADNLIHLGSPQTAAAEIVTPSGDFEIQCLAHTVLRFLTMECDRSTMPTCSKSCARPAGRNGAASSTSAILGGLQLK